MPGDGRGRRLSVSALRCSILPPVNTGRGFSEQQTSQGESPSRREVAARSASAVDDGRYPRISALAVSDPERSFSQEQVLELLGMSGDPFAERMFARCGVKRRQLELSEQMLSGDLQARTSLVEEHLLAHAIRAVDRLELEPSDVGTVITSTLYSLGVPTLAHRLAEHRGLSPDTDKYHLIGVGCASAVPLIRLAAQSLQGDRAQKAVIVAADCMSGMLTREALG